MANGNPGAKRHCYGRPITGTSNGLNPKCGLQNAVRYDCKPLTKERVTEIYLKLENELPRFDPNSTFELRG